MDERLQLINFLKMSAAVDRFEKTQKQLKLIRFEKRRAEVWSDSR